ncbi:MAG: rhodanese-like domain-containing protein [Thermoleophilia bacterium]|nr:rhodanese-like domain-containing protein [Thermoleophilia bacterium]
MQTGIMMFLIGAIGALIIIRVGSHLRKSALISGGAGAGINEIDAGEAATLISQKGAVVFDVRTSAEYAAGRIPRANHVPLRQLPQRMESLNKYKSRPVLVSCRTGRRSASACAYLTENGFEEVYNLKGGLRAWTHARQKVEN